MADSDGGTARCSGCRSLDGEWGWCGGVLAPPACEPGPGPARAMRRNRCGGRTFEGHPLRAGAAKILQGADWASASAAAAAAAVW